MAVYAIGDVQGCLDQLLTLLDLVRFDPAPDRLLFVGDLVNRGPRSVDTLRFVQSLAGSATTVLGNHDLHLLAVASGAREARCADTFDDVLQAADRDALCAWLLRRPLLHEEPDGTLLVHAGIPPGWGRDEATARARELEAVLGGPEPGDFFARMYGDEPARWTDGLPRWDRLRYTVNALTRMRYLDGDGALELHCNACPGQQPDGLVPWYAVAERALAGAPVVFGHWATLVLPAALSMRYGVTHLDTGCVWGGRLTALRLDDGRMFSVPGLADPPARR